MLVAKHREGGGCRAALRLACMIKAAVPYSQVLSKHVCWYASAVCGIGGCPLTEPQDEWFGNLA